MAKAARSRKSSKKTVSSKKLLKTKNNSNQPLLTGVKPWRSKKGRSKIHRVMHEWKHHDPRALHSGSHEGPVVPRTKRGYKQAVAIGLSEAREELGLPRWKGKKNRKPAKKKS